jgi:glycerate-2-kinase
MERNAWLHNLPECTTYARAVDCLKRYEVWDEVAPAVREWLERADPAYETVKREEFEKTRFRIFGVMPLDWGMRPTAARKAAELGFTPHILYNAMHADAGQTAQVISAIALNCETTGEPFEPPCVLIGGSEMLVTVGKGQGMGGRNQEFALTTALRIAGSENVVVASADSDGTDGPGRQFYAVGDIPALDGGLVDGTTLARAKEAGIDVLAELAQHNTSPVLWALGDAILATPNISVNDLMVTLVLGRKAK